MAPQTLLTRPDPRSVYRPAGVRSQPRGPVLRRPHMRPIMQAMVDFYRDRLSWLALAVTSVLMCYIGGAAMFWFHAVKLGEGGPAISWQAHWLLDSTFGFVVLTPVLLVLLPMATWAAQALGRGADRLVPWLYAVIAGTAFAVVATPGPIAHDLVVGRGTWLATEVTRLIGNPGAVLPPKHEYPVLAALTQQFGAGVPLYVALMGLAVLVVRVIAGRRVPGNAGASPR